MRTLIAIAVCTLVPSTAASLGAADKVDFEKDVRPILESKCFECHGETKAKSRLRLHTPAEAHLGGKSEKAIVPGKPDESVLITRISLSADDEDVMPPADEGEPLTKEQIDVLRRWIGEGAEYPAGAAEAAAAANQKRTGDPLTPEQEQKLEAIRAAGGRAMRLAQDVNWVTVSYRPAADQVGDEQVALVRGIANVAELNLAGTGVTDAGLANLAELENLTRLHLERTAVRGDGLANLAKLARLEYLNLYGTEVDDAALAHLAKLPSLRKLYLWQTKVTDEGVAALVAANPELYVNRGIDPPALAHPDSASTPAENATPEAEKPADAPAEAKVAAVVIAASSAGWRFRAQAGLDGDTWLGDGFDDAAWAEGKAPLGYGEAFIDERKGTKLALTGQNVLARRVFDVDETTIAGAKAFRLRVASDNSAIVSINGKEVDRDTDNHEAAYWNRTVELPADVVRAGKNVIAVVIHNNAGSSDAILDVEIAALAK